MTITTTMAPVVGSMLSLEAMLDRVLRPMGTLSSQGLPLLLQDGKGLSNFLATTYDNLDSVKKTIGLSWRHAWCEYQQSPHRGRGRPTARIAFHFLFHLNGFDLTKISDEDIHRLFSMVFTKVEETRNARFFVFVFRRSHARDVLVHVLAHPVDLMGYCLRFDNQFPARFQEIIEVVFSSDIRKVARLWVSS
jgi:hypothetical protein